METGDRRLFERLAAQANRVEVKRDAMLRERDRLDALIADAVTTRPDSAQWYAYAGTLTIDEAIAAVGGGYAGLAAAMDRQRKALADAKPAKGKRKPAGRAKGSRAAARRASSSRAQQP